MAVNDSLREGEAVPSETRGPARSETGVKATVEDGPEKGPARLAASESSRLNDTHCQRHLFYATRSFASYTIAHTVLP